MARQPPTKPAGRSHVIAFRLHPANPDEARALAVLDRLRRQGHATRQIMLGALLSLDGIELPAQQAAPSPGELRALIAELREYLAVAQAGAPMPAPDAPPPPGRVSQALLDYLAGSAVLSEESDP